MYDFRMLIAHVKSLLNHGHNKLSTKAIGSSDVEDTNQGIHDSSAATSQAVQGSDSAIQTDGEYEGIPVQRRRSNAFSTPSSGTAELCKDA